jgi:hypothetical protein
MKLSPVTSVLRLHKPIPDLVARLIDPRESGYGTS